MALLADAPHAADGSLRLAAAEGGSGTAPPWEVDDAFPEIPHELMRPGDWSVTRAGRWEFTADIHEKEARAMAASIERFARTRFGRDCHRLNLGDNMGDVLVFERGRAKEYPLLVQVRRWCGAALARNIRPAVRWVSSEANVADAPSRGRPLMSGAAAEQLCMADAVDEVMDAQALLEHESVTPSPPVHHTRGTPGGAGRTAAARIASFSAGVAAVPVTSAQEPLARAEPEPDAAAVAPVPRTLRATRCGVKAARRAARAAAARPGTYVADLYGRGGGIADAVERSGFEARRLHAALGDEGNLERGPVRRGFLREVAAGKVVGAFLAPGAEASARGMVEVVESLSEHGVPWILLAPTRSVVTDSARARIEAFPTVSRTTLDLCRWGSRARGRSDVWASLIDAPAARSLSQTCDGRGCCQRSGRPHIFASASLPSGLRRRMAWLLVDGERAKYMNESGY